jgi:hypothetical protein
MYSLNSTRDMISEYHNVGKPVPVRLIQSERIITLMIIKCDIDHIVTLAC